MSDIFYKHWPIGFFICMLLICLAVMFPLNSSGVGTTILSKEKVEVVEILECSFSSRGSDTCQYLLSDQTTQRLGFSHLKKGDPLIHVKWVNIWGKYGEHYRR